MASNRERAPRERETLIFTSPEEAQEWREGLKEGEQPVTPGLRRDREALSDAVAAEFDKLGEPVGQYEQPWEHDEEEHSQAQELVNVAFADDLETALKLARKSPQYPRIIDLFHDVLVGQLYDELVKDGVNARSLHSRPVLIALGLIVLSVLLALIMFLL